MWWSVVSCLPTSSIALNKMLGRVLRSKSRRRTFCICGYDATGFARGWHASFGCRQPTCNFRISFWLARACPCEAVAGRSRRMCWTCVQLAGHVKRLDLPPCRYLHGQILKETVGFMSAQAPVMPTAPPSPCFPAASYVRGRPSTGRHRWPGRTGRHPERWARCDRRGWLSPLARNPHRPRHLVSAQPAAISCATCRSTREPLRWACRSRLAWWRYADAAACATGFAGACPSS